MDPVRFISNHSSGKMGYAIAEAARDRGAAATLVSAPTALLGPVCVRTVRAETALEMRQAILDECGDADALIMAAAVTDWRPASLAAQKLKKGASETWSVELAKNPDILDEVRGENLIKVGFAAESEDLLANARAKLAAVGSRRGRGGPAPAPQVRRGQPNTRQSRGAAAVDGPDGPAKRRKPRRRAPPDAARKPSVPPLPDVKSPFASHGRTSVHSCAV
jgi:hypothetical protein